MLRTFGKARGALWAPLVLVVLLAGCDPQRISELEEGVATEADVRARFGEPAAVYTEDNGARTFDYPRQPAGQVNYMITIGTDGKMSALRQVLKPANFAKVLPGLDKAAVRRLLGKPAQVQRYALKQEEVWDWRFADGQENKVFSATFDVNGNVVASATTLDPRDVGQAGK
ncbi:MAG: outer membrane protein assembly factor BamE [Burkholderiales bacterium]|nr:outer membrane protein assembly factor BamE [Burkholderiales bacterium]